MLSFIGIFLLWSTNDGSGRNATPLGYFDEVCLTPLCIKAAAATMSRMNASVDPCVDFYSFACGGLDNDLNVIPDHKSSISWASDLQHEIDKQLRLLMENIPEKNESHYLTKMSIVYTKCMNATEHEELGDEPLRFILEELGGWPVVDSSNWTEANFSLDNYLVQMKRHGFKHDLLASIDVHSHVLAHKFNLIYIGTADLGLDDRSYYLEPEYNDTIEAYHTFMVEAATELGAEPEVASKEMRKVVEFETEIAKLMLPRDTHTNILNYMNLSLITDTAPAINWTKYLNGIFHPFIYIPENAVLIVKNPSYLSNISSLVEATDSRTLANFLSWHVILQSTSLLDDKWSRMGRKLFKKLDGRPQLRPKWEYCLSLVKRYFPIGMSSLYISNLPKEQEEQVALVKDIVEYIMRAFKNILLQNTWMDKETIKEAINKTDRIKIFAGFPMQLFNETAINEEYELDRTRWTWSFFYNILIIRRTRMDMKYIKVQFDNVKGNWIEYAKVADVNAYYRTQENSIEFPISIIRAFNIHKDKPMYLNFGDIGWVIGHEITHGFDNMGRLFDGEGEYRSWWTNETSQMFDSKANCFSEQYASYDVKGSTQKINGNLTLGENIADNGGMKEAFRAYEDYVQKNGRERRLPGLPYSPEQLFFIESASFYCGRHRKQVAEYALKTDSHSPNAFRVIGTMSNLQAFADTFSCPQGSPMNPVDKCMLW